jgi:DNA adenine methylase
MKPPLTYYGGKQLLSKEIMSLIPKHNLYCEPFFGGGAVFFFKEPSQVEVINDTNGELINFYKVIKNDFKKLQKEIKTSLHSRKLHAQANVIYKHSELFSEVERAWAIWMLANQSYASKLNGSWGYEKSDNRMAGKIHEKRMAFTEQFAERLEKVQIECADALRVIETRDTKESFFYCDPPYFNAHLGHYKGYTQNDFEQLLEVLSKIRGKFLLSSYPSKTLATYAKKHKWFVKKIDTQLCLASGPNVKKKRKIEVLTANFDIKQ